MKIRSLSTQIVRLKALNQVQKLPSWYTRSSTAVHCRTLASSLTLLTFRVTEDFAVPAATATFSLQFTALGVELPATGRYVGAISDNRSHSTRDVSVH